VTAVLGQRSQANQRSELFMAQGAGSGRSVSSVALKTGPTPAPNATNREEIYKDDGHSGARLDRPALDRLRDAAANGAFDVLLITSPDRRARRYADQVWLLEEFERAGVQVIFLERPPTGDPQDALVIQIRGAVAEYERTVIADRMRRGRLAALLRRRCC
jgi:DNA invertase Pin-like site-specific DNA recombinase